MSFERERGVYRLGFGIVFISVDFVGVFAMGSTFIVYEVKG